MKAERKQKRQEVKIITRQNRIKFLGIFLLTLIVCLSFSQAKSLISQPEYKVKMDLGVMIPMRDAVKLSSDFYFPDADGKFPAILIRTPYNNSRSRYDRYGKFYASRGYVVVIQDCRGRFDSEGEWYPMEGEEYDGYDTIEWIAKQPWSNEKVGMTGVSYVGFVQWMAASGNPPHYTKYKKFYFHSRGNANTLYGDGYLNMTSPGKEPPDKYIYDPADPVPSIRGGTGARGGISSDPIDQRVNEKRMDVLCYTSEGLKDDLEVTGPIKIILYASSLAKDTDFGGKLVDVHPNGTAYNVCFAASGLISARFRESLEKPSLIEPGKVYKYEIKLRPTGIVFKKGHKIRVEISSSDFPIFNRNLNTGKDPYTSTDMVKARQKIYHNAEYPSHIVLPIIERKK